jgi:hypothetical protein
MEYPISTRKDMKLIDGSVHRGIACTTAWNNVVVIGTSSSRGWVIKHAFGVGDSHGKISIFCIDTLWIHIFYWFSILMCGFYSGNELTLDPPFDMGYQIW